MLRIVAFILSVYVPMFFQIYLNPRAPEGPANMVFLRDLIAVTALKNVFVKDVKKVDTHELQEKKEKKAASLFLYQIK